MVQHFAHKTLSQHRNMHQQHIQSKICFYFAVFQVKLCVSTMYNIAPPHMKCPILKQSTNVPYLKICRSFDTTLNTFDSVIFISKVLIILMRFRALLYFYGERARVRCIHSVRHVCNGISDPGNDSHEY